MAEDGDDGMHGIETSINCKQKLISEAVPSSFSWSLPTWTRTLALSKKNALTVGWRAPKGMSICSMNEWKWG